VYIRGFLAHLRNFILRYTNVRIIIIIIIISTLMTTSYSSPVIDVKKRFLRFLVLSRFYVFNFFLFSVRFLK